MFGSADQPRSIGWLAPVIGVVVVGLALTGIYVWNRPSTATSAAASAPLELVSLRHERQGDQLIVSGLVRNPLAGPTIARLSAVVFTFDRQGTFVASGRAQLDVARLGAGDESPFSIAVPQAAGVGRYRVSFRTDDSVVPHLDRRAPPATAVPVAQVSR
jgi:hypothetical protein